MEAELNIVLHSNQKKIHESKARFKVIKAGKRFGKSKWAVYEIIKAAGKKPNGLFWYIAPTFGQAEDIAWATLIWMLPSKYIKNKWISRLTVELVNGSKIVLKGAENEVSLRGIQVDGYVLDEVAYFSEYVWSGILYGQLAPGGFAYFISSPNKTGRNWYTNFCLDAQMEEQKGNPDWAYFYFTIYDNPTYPKKQIEDMRAKMPDSTFELEYMAIESAHSGQLFAEFTSEKNVGEYSGKDAIRHFRFVDPGLDHPTVCLWAAFSLAERMVYIQEEWVKSGFTVPENCEVIKKRTGDRNVEWTVIDPSSAQRDKVSKRALIDEFSRYGVTCIPGDRRERGYDIVKMFLKTGKLKISPRCKTLIFELQNLQWGDKEGDDTTDALRYGLVRIHDFLFGMNLLTQVAKAEEPSDPRELNMYDQNMFPKAPLNGINWLKEEQELCA